MGSQGNRSHRQGDHPMTRTAQTARLLEAAFDDYAPDEMGWQRYRAREQAKQHLASMTPERRALLEREWAA